MKRSQVALCVLIALFCMSLSVHAQSKDTENVFIIVIDGIRNEEAFDDPTHQFIPYIWDELRPLGTIYTECYNDYLTTYTTPGHEAAITGVWHYHPNLMQFGNNLNDCRPEVPTIFEYYRYHTGQPQESCLVVTGKKNCLQLDWSLEPSYGPAYSSLIFEGGSDNQTCAVLQDKLNAHHPRLVLVNLQDVDKYGHTGNWSLYTNAIVHADYLVYRIWTEMIQGDPFYADKTTMIVTTDHGRNDDTVGFKQHGGMSHSNRHIMFLAIGPDTPQGAVVSERRYQIDLAPTVGELLDFPTPYARGQVMTGMFESGIDPDPRIHTYARHPRMATYNGTVAVAWSENDPDDTGNERIYVMTKGPDDPDYGDPVLISNPSAGRWAMYPAITANPDGLHAVWLDGRALAGQNDTWSIFYRKSPDWGETWETEKMIATSVFETPGWNRLEMVIEPEITSSSAGILVISVRLSTTFRKLTSFRSLDGGNTWTEFLIGDRGNWPRGYRGAPLSAPNEATVVCMDMLSSPGAPLSTNWEIVSKTTLNGGLTWKYFKRLTYDVGYSYTPGIAYNGQRLAVAWAERPIDGTKSQIHVRTSANKGKTWGSGQVFQTDASAWSPMLIWDPSNENYFMIWTDYTTGLPDLAYSTMAEGENWTNPVVVPRDNSALCGQPQAVYSEGSIYLAWEEQDPTTQDWVIRTSTLTP